MATIQMPAGTIPSYSFASGNTYQAHASGTKIENLGTAPFTHAANINGLRDLTIIGVEFSGGLKGDNLTNVTLKNCRFTNCKRNADDHQAFNGANLTNVRFEDCWYENNNWCAIFNGLCKQVRIIRGGATKCNIHLKAMLNNGSDIAVDGFYNHDSSAYYQVEFQPSNKASSANIIATAINCAIERPVMNSSNVQSNTGGWSIPMEQGTVIISHNYFDGTTQDGRKPVKGGFLGPLMVIEMGSAGGSCNDNWVCNANDPVSVNPVSQNCQTTNNLIQNCLETANMQGGGPAGTNTFTHNDANTILPVDGGWKYAGKTPPGSVTPPIPPSDSPTRAEFDALKEEVSKLQAYDAHLKEFGKGWPQ